jgi:hypothetical protein
VESVVICWSLGVVLGVLMLTAEILKLAALLTGSLLFYLGGAALSGAGYLSGAYLEALLLGFRTELADPDLVRIRGVHPDYLARLPEYEPPRPPSPVDGGQSD